MKTVSTGFNDSPEKASKPFDKLRDGFVLGEGAWMFIVESDVRAKERGAKILAEITGYASTCEAFHRVALKSDGVEPARAMELAVERAGISSDAVQTIQLHGTATVMNDNVETLAVKRVFGKRAMSMPLTALKSMIGHPQGACGAAGVMAAVYSLLHQYVPPTINYETPDPNCDLNYTPNKGIVKDVENVLCNTIAFGSKNSALVLKRWATSN
jgi:3-oxoacyl-[acyl-carrier-protein] synthase II